MLLKKILNQNRNLNRRKENELKRKMRSHDTQTYRTQLRKKKFYSLSSVQFSRSVVSDSLWPHESQHARPPCPSPTPGAHSDSRPSGRWCHPAISSSVVPFSSCLLLKIKRKIKDKWEKHATYAMRTTK